MSGHAVGKKYFDLCVTLIYERPPYHNVVYLVLELSMEKLLVSFFLGFQLHIRKFRQRWALFTFSTFHFSGSQPVYDSRHPSLVMEQFGGTTSTIYWFNRCQIQKLVAPLELFQGTLECCSTPVENHCSTSTTTSTSRIISRSLSRD